MNWTDTMIDEYVSWLHQRPTILCDIATGWAVSPTPFVGLFNDLMELFVKQEGDDILLSDDGLTLWNAESAGLDIHSAEVQSLLQVILKKYGVAQDDEFHLTKRVASEDFGQGKHDLTMAMLAVNDMASKGSSIFQSNVRQLMLSGEVNALPQILIKGRSGIDFTFDYIISRPKTEYIIQSVGHLDKNVLASFIFGIEEVKDYRRLVSMKDVKGIIIVNDIELPVHQEYLQALVDRQLDYVLWSQRAESLTWAKICATV